MPQDTIVLLQWLQALQCRDTSQDRTHQGNFHYYRVICRCAIKLVAGFFVRALKYVAIESVMPLLYHFLRRPANVVSAMVVLYPLLGRRVQVMRV